MSDDQDLDDLREQSVSGGGNRIDADAEKEQATLKDELKDALERSDEGDVSKTVSFWDPRLGALLDVLEDHPERREQIVRDLADQLDRDVADGDRASFLKLAWRAALADVDDELLDELEDAAAERAAEEASQSL